ncbi:unnamed protein product [Oncorhynchus mykiss]|uniref:Calponin-homology (CH) domain-containing protein n=1 Tax=Oncorhynchus mykiss TaxID=8022 RepID=A0A060W2K4_ONCMY|nr:unnamed protein product [Oncorhynchus mykiss]
MHVQFRQRHMFGRFLPCNNGTGQSSVRIPVPQLELGYTLATAAGECSAYREPYGGVRVMAHYNATPAGYMLADEKEYLQAYEDVLEKYKDERDRVQKKTFTKWINQHLLKVRKHVNDLYEDLRDGHNLISLLEVLSGQSLPREKGRMRFHRLQNVQIALDYLKRRQVKLVNIRNDDITDGNPKLTLGLIWTIILHFQVRVHLKSHILFILCCSSSVCVNQCAFSIAVFFS